MLKRCGGVMKKVIVVERNKNTAAVIESILVMLGFEYIEFKSVQGIVEVCKKIKPELVLLAWSDEQSDSINTIAEIKKEEKTTVLCCSSYATMDKIQQALNAGADEYLIKPFDYDILRSKLSIVGML